MASRIQGITVEIGGDTTKLGNALKSVNDKTKSLQSELKGVNTLLKMDPTNVTLLRQKQDLLNQSIAECREKLNILKSTQQQVQEQFDKGEITEQQYRDFQREIVSTENKLKSLTNEAKSFGSVGAQQVAAVGEKVENLGNKVTNAGKSFSVVSAGIVAIGTASVAMFKEVDAGADIAIKATGAVGDQAKAIEDSYKNVASSVKGEFSDIGAALGEVNTRFGFTGQELEKCTTQFVKFGEVTGADVTSAVQKVSRYMGDASIDSSQYSKVLDNLTVACQASGISMDSLTETLVSYGAPMRALGFETEEAIAIFSQWEKAGVNTSIAFSGMKTAISKWSAEGKDAREEFKKTLEEIKSCPDIASATTKAIEAFGKKAGPDLADAIKGGRFEYEDFLTLLQNSEGQLDGTYDEVIDGADEAKIAMQNMKLALSEIGNTIMTMLSPIIQKVSEHIKQFAEKWRSLSPEVQKVIIIIGGLVAAIGPVLIIIGKLMSSIGSIMTYGPKLVSMFGTVKTALSGLFSFIAANPVILVITAIIAAVVLLWNKCEWFRNLVMALFEAIKNALITVWNNIKAVWDFVYPYFVALWEGIKASLEPVIQAVIGAFQSAWEFIKTIWDIVQPYFATLWEAIKAVFSVVVEVLGTYFRVAWETIKAVWDVVVQYFSLIWENIKTVFSVVATVIGGFFEAAWTVIKTIWDAVTGYFQAIFDTIKGIFSAVTAVFHGDFSGAWEAIKGIVNTWGQYFQGIWDGIKNIFSSVANFFKNSFQAAWDGIKNIFSNVGSFFQGIWNTIKNMFTRIGTTIGDAVGGAFKSVVNSIISWAQNTINGFIRSINWAIGVINNIPGVNIPKLNELSLPRLKVGMANVPYDDYLALLHKGERVLTAKENQEYTSGMEEPPSNNNIDNSFNLTINSPTETSPAENARLLRKEIQRYRLQHG